MRNGKKSPKILHPAMMKKVEQWSRTHMLIRISTKN